MKKVFKVFGIAAIAAALVITPWAKPVSAETTICGETGYRLQTTAYTQYDTSFKIYAKNVSGNKVKVCGKLTKTNNDTNRIRVTMEDRNGNNYVTNVSDGSYVYSEHTRPVETASGATNWTVGKNTIAGKGSYEWSFKGIAI